MGRRVACFAMSTAQKFHALKQVVSELVDAGAEVRFWTDAKFRPEVEAVGASFADLFDPVSLDEVDDVSRPIPSRYVTFAAERGAAIAEQVAIWGAEVVVYDSFTIIGEVVARRLGIPWVPVFSPHLIDSSVFRERVAKDPRVATDPRCAAAVEHLRDEFGVTNASRFSYFAQPSPWLNVACEPEAWVDAEETRLYRPLASFGKLSADALVARRRARRANARPQIYVAFGTVIWWYWSSQAAAALEVIAEAAKVVGADLVIGLGGGTLPVTTRERLKISGVVIHDFADQRQELAAADLFITHCGSTSAHEAVALTVPMLSVPFSGDQPDVAALCEKFGLALPLINATARDEELDLQHVIETIGKALSGRDAMLEALSRARTWELTALAQRPAIARRILALPDSS